MFIKNRKKQEEDDKEIEQTLSQRVTGLSNRQNDDSDIEMDDDDFNEDTIIQKSSTRGTRSRGRATRARGRGRASPTKDPLPMIGSVLSIMINKWCNE